MEVPATDSIVNYPGFPGMEVPVSDPPAVLYIQELRQKRDTAAEVPAYNCFTVKEGGKFEEKKFNKNLN